jgi:hypothetical protein
VTGAPDRGQPHDNQDPGRSDGSAGPHGVPDEQVAAAFAEAFGWTEPAAEPRPAEDPLRAAFLASATRALDAEPTPDFEPPEAVVTAAATDSPGVFPAVGEVAEAAAIDPVPPTTALSRLQLALAVAEAAPGFVASSLVRVPEGLTVAHHSHFAALDDDRIGRLAAAWVAGLTAAIDAVGGHELFGLVDTALITTEAATIHLGLIDDHHAVVVVTDSGNDDADLQAGRDALVSCAVAVDNLLG